jgi:hypothetical protein
VTKPLTQQFRDLYALGSLWPKWARFLWLGFLVWLEERYLHYLTEQRVTEAVEEYERIDPPDVRLPDPIYTETDSPTSQVLPEMRIQAPWRRD